MHVLATRPGGYGAGDGLVDLAQTPARIVVLSAADTDLKLLADACDALPADFPSLRLASLLALRANASVDLYFDAVLAHAELVVVALTGGVSYWPYGVERLSERVGSPGFGLVLVPGDDAVDPELDRLSSAPAELCRTLWRYLREGGPGNARAFLSFVAAQFFDRSEPYAPPTPLPRTVLYHPRRPSADLRFLASTWQPGRPVAVLLFYRAHVQAGNLRAVDALIEALWARGLNPLPMALASLKDPACRAELDRALSACDAAIVLNTTAFALGSPAEDATSSALAGERPVLQVVLSGGDHEAWQSGLAGLSPSDLAMNVVLPEVDGRIITRAVSFKGRARRSERAQLEVTEYQPDLERVTFVAELARATVELARTPAAERRIALVLSNYPARDGRLGNGVGLDTPASIVAILQALQQAGYAVSHPPADGEALMAALLSRVTNELDLLPTRPAEHSIAIEDYRAFLATLPRGLVAAVEARWGAPQRDPRARGDRLVVSGLSFGNVFVGIQPARGYEIDVAATYHDPALVPPHGYLAFYAFLRRVLRVHAVVHVGKHGTLEWLPGKSVALSSNCWPDAVLGPTPHVYPFIVNDPGEGAQAKRRAQAVIVDHLVPPLTRAESYGVLRDLERLVDEYYQALALDPRRAEPLRRDILRLARSAQLDRELGFPELTQRAVRSADQDRFLVSLDAYLCELKESQIRAGLHVFGRSPSDLQRADTLVALARHGRKPGDHGLVRGLARALLGSDADALGEPPSSAWTGARPVELAAVDQALWRSVGDTLERLELYARDVLLGQLPRPDSCRALIERVEREVAPRLDQSGDAELQGLLRALDGRHVPAGPSGAPTRGRLDVLPTGRNFYTVDVRTMPTPQACELGRRAAERLVARYVQDHGTYPRSIALSAWGTATMRTGGDDIAQALALLGVRPVWAEGSFRVVDTEILPVSSLRRPRVDVLLRISGFFRDAFPELVRIFDAAVRAVSELDEPADENPVRARAAAAEAALRAQSVDAEEARRRARRRIFGAPPGSYGTGLQAVVDHGVWRERAELADAFVRWGSYAYGEAAGPARDELAAHLGHVEAVVQNQDNREHDVLDSDDYYQFQGGLAAAVAELRGVEPALYHGDHHRPDDPRVRALHEEIARVVRSRAANPKWIAAMREHGYKGAAELAATVDLLFGYAATTDAVRDHQFAALSDAYLRDPETRRFLARHNPSALREMTERMLDAAARGLWREPGDHRETLTELLLDAEEGNLP